eukprot:9900030-Alexandrium_andersonii.AAC.1
MVWFKRSLLRFIGLPPLRESWPVGRRLWPASTTHGARPSYAGPLCLATLQHGSSAVSYTHLRAHETSAHL